MDGETFDPVKDVVDDLLQFRTVKVERDNFDDTDMGRLPSRVRMTVTSPDGLSTRSSTPSAAVQAAPTTSPFSIPEALNAARNL